MDEVEKNIDRLERAIIAARKDSDVTAERDSLSELGDYYSGLGELKLAIQCYERALSCESVDAMSAASGSEFWRMSLSVAQLGGRRRAIELAEAALKIYESARDAQAETVRAQLQKWKDNQ